MDLFVKTALGLSFRKWQRLILFVVTGWFFASFHAVSEPLSLRLAHPFHPDFNVGSVRDLPQEVNSELWVIDSHGRLYHSADGIDWEIVETNLRSLLPNNHLAWISPGKLAYSFERYYFLNDDLFASSKDGKFWIRHEVPDGFQQGDIKSENERIIEGNNHLVVIGRSRILTSSNGFDFQFVYRANTSLSDITFAQGRFVVVGNNNSILTSIDSYHWETVESEVDFRSVAFGHEKFIATTGNGTIAMSIDGIEWQELPVTVRGAVIYTSLGFLSLSSNSLWSSVDGIDWIHQYAEGHSLTEIQGRVVLKDSQKHYFLERGAHYNNVQLDEVTSTGNLVGVQGNFAIIDSGNTAFVSADGLNWESKRKVVTDNDQVLPPSFVRGTIYYNDNQFIHSKTNLNSRVSGVFSSQNGYQWNKISNTDMGAIIAFGNDVAVGFNNIDGTILTSSIKGVRRNCLK